MLLKWIGIVIVMLSSALAGFYYGNMDTFRISDLSEMKKALAILRSEIEFALTPLPEALETIVRRTKNPICHIFHRLLEALNEGAGVSVGELWEQALEETKNETYFNQEDVEQLVSFGKTLGYLDKGMQLSHIQIVTDYIDDKMQALNEVRYKNRRMYQSLGVLCGVLVVIVLL